MNQSATFDNIPKKEAISIILGGNAATSGTQHNTVHDILENDLYDRYRKGGDRYGHEMTVREYNNALNAAMEKIGVKAEELGYVMNLVIAEQLHYGYTMDSVIDPKGRVAGIVKRPF
ncbi:hypothetical protein [Rubinisphaera margarita]|uniref:hypothetical protein n=1 Tax=Rubinisphaera margarita TaxID=2909586 RepID=UPI001EE81389|nr:hypothetical protein [Rubinisphaera margarita]MCG6154621.1 hypothetical protein [Rubinisphaera margarita]